MEIIPVIDVMNGKAVGGKSGMRQSYTPLKTIFSSSSNPIDIAKNLPYEHLYVADLDGIVNGTSDFELIGKLAGMKKLMVDAGVRNYEDVEKLSRLGAGVVIGTETVKSIDVIKKALKNKNNVAVSIDVKNNVVLSNFLPEKPEDAFSELRKSGARKFIILDISAVGTLSGFNFDFCRFRREKLKIFVGGGITKEDIKKLEKKGIDGALVGTALHRGLL